MVKRWMIRLFPEPNTKKQKANSIRNIIYFKELLVRVNLPIAWPDAMYNTKINVKTYLSDVPYADSARLINRAVKTRKPAIILLKYFCIDGFQSGLSLIRG